MRRWLRAAGPALEVVDRPDTWIPAALAWLATVGWIPLVVGVTTVPSAGDLTVWGAGIVTSGAWPWNAVLLVSTLVVAALVAFAAAALGTTALRAAIDGITADPPAVVRQLAVALAAGAPAVVATVVVLVGLAAIAPIEVNRPATAPDPIVRILARLAPLFAFAAALAVAGAALVAVAGREAVARRSAIDGLGAAPSRIRQIGAPVVVHLAVTVALTLLAVGASALLADVLWAPISVRLARGTGPDAVSGLLLVGFVAIWLCTVLGGGALHAWSTATWSRLLDPEPSTGRTAREAAWKP